MADRFVSAIFGLFVASCAISFASGSSAQQAIGSTTTVQNQVTRELSGGSAPLSVGDSVFRNEVVRTGANSLAKLVFVNSTNLAVGPTSRVVLDRFVYEGDPNAEKVAVGLAKGVLPVHDRHARQEGVYDYDADRRDRRTRHGARHRRAKRRHARDAGRRSGACMPTKERGHPRAAGAQLRTGVWRLERTVGALRLRTTRSFRPDRDRQEGRRHNASESDEQSGEFRVALHGRCVALLRRLFRRFCKPVGGGVVRPLKKIARGGGIRLAALVGILAFGSIITSRAALAYCAWNGVTDAAYNGPTPGPIYFTNMVAKQGNVCSESASGSFQALLNAPAPQGGPPVDTGVPYTGFVFISFDGGQISASGRNLSITSYPATQGTYPPPTYTASPYGVSA